MIILAKGSIYYILHALLNVKFLLNVLGQLMILSTCTSTVLISELAVICAAAVKGLDCAYR